MNKRLYSLIMLFLLSLSAVMPAQAMLVRAGRMLGRYVPLVRTLAANTLESSSRGARAGRVPKSLPFNWQSTVKVPAGKAFARRHSSRAGAHASNSSSSQPASSSLKPAKKLLIGAAGVVGGAGITAALTMDQVYAEDLDLPINLKEIIDSGDCYQFDLYMQTCTDEVLRQKIIDYSVAHFGDINPSILLKIMKIGPGAAVAFTPKAVSCFTKLASDISGVLVLCEIVANNPDAAREFVPATIVFSDTLIKNSEFANKKMFLFLIANVVSACPDAARELTPIVFDECYSDLKKCAFGQGQILIKLLFRCDPNAKKRLKEILDFSTEIAELDNAKFSDFAPELEKMNSSFFDFEEFVKKMREKAINILKSEKDLLLKKQEIKEVTQELEKMQQLQLHEILANACQDTFSEGLEAEELWCYIKEFEERVDFGGRKIEFDTLKYSNTRGLYVSKMREGEFDDVLTDEERALYVELYKEKDVDGSIFISDFFATKSRGYVYGLVRHELQHAIHSDLRQYFQFIRLLKNVTLDSNIQNGAGDAFSRCFERRADIKALVDSDGRVNGYAAIGLLLFLYELRLEEINIGLSKFSGSLDIEDFDWVFPDTLHPGTQERIDTIVELLTQADSNGFVSKDIVHRLIFDSSDCRYSAHDFITAVDEIQGSACMPRVL